MLRSFLDLPAELRLAIYDHLVRDARASGYAHVLKRLPNNRWHASLEQCRQSLPGHNHHSGACVHIGSPVKDHNPVYTVASKSDIRALALTCRKTYLEVAPLLRACDKLTIHWRPLYAERETLPQIMGVLDCLSISPLIDWRMNTHALHIYSWDAECLDGTKAHHVMSRYLGHELTGLKTLMWTFVRPAFRRRMESSSAVAELRDHLFFLDSRVFLKSFMCNNPNRQFTVALQVEGDLHILARLDDGKATSADCVRAVEGPKWQSGEWFKTGIAHLQEEVPRARALRKQRVKRRETDQIIESLEETLVMRGTIEWRNRVSRT